MSGDSGVSVSVSQRSPSSGSGSMTIGGIGGGPFMVKYFLLYIDVFIVISYRKMSGKIFYFEWMNEWMNALFARKHKYTMASKAMYKTWQINKQQRTVVTK